MDSSRDNLLIRFKAFIDGLGIFTIFALAILVIFGTAALFGWFDKGQEPEDAAAEVRYENKEALDEAQAAVISPEQMAAAMPEVAKSLVSSSPKAVEEPGQVIPGSPTAEKIANEPAVDTTAVDQAEEDGKEAEPIDPAVMEIGKTQYLVCGACHGQNGEGSPAGPPLAGSEWVTGPISNLIRIQLRGLIGPITVAGKEYDFPGGMAPMSYQTDEQVAGVLTYIRNSFGNEASAVKPEQVASLRSEVGKPQLKVEELKQP